MNKFAIVALLACVGLVQAGGIGEIEEQQAVADQSWRDRPTDADETAGLNKETDMFRDFCLHQRDSVLDDVRRTINGKASQVFTMLLMSAQNLGLEALETQRVATEKLADQLEHPKQAITSGEESSAVDQIIREGQEEIQTSHSPATAFFKAITASLAATKSVISKRIADGLQLAKRSLDNYQVLVALDGACDKLKEYEQTIRTNFEETRREFASTMPKVALLQLEDVKCATTGRVLSLEGVCHLAKAAKEPVQKLLAVWRPSQTAAQMQFDEMMAQNEIDSDDSGIESESETSSDEE